MFATSFIAQIHPDDASLHAEIRDSIERLLANGEWASYRASALDELKETISQQLGVATVRLCASGSLAVELALRGCGVGDGDEIICPALDYPGNIRAVRLLHGLPVMVDSSEDRWTIDVDQVEKAGTARTRAVIASHLYGEVADVERLRLLCDQRGWSLIEDACQMPGGTIAGRALGSFGHVGTFSFGGSKPLTAGSGGAVVTNDPRIAQRIAAYLDRPSDAATLSPLQAAVLLPQWRRLGKLIARQESNLRSLIDRVATRTPHWQWPCERPLNRVGCYYKVPISIGAKPDSSDASFEAKRQQTITHLELAGCPAGLPFRVITKTAHGRGFIHGSRNSESIASRGVLLDHRCICGSSENLNELATQLILVHDEINRR